MMWVTGFFDTSLNWETLDRLSLLGVWKTGLVSVS